MLRLPLLEYNLSHPHPRNRLFLVTTIILFALVLPVLIIVNIVTTGFELIPSLQPEFHPNGTWWGTRHLPSLLRPRAPPCQPNDIGRGDVFRLSSSLFDYTVISAWDTSKDNETSIAQAQKRPEYQGQSFSDCFANSTWFEYSLIEQTHSITVNVLCPGSAEYPIRILMQTKVTFSWDQTKNFIAQSSGVLGGPNPDFLKPNEGNPSDYRKLVLAVLDVISTDSVNILQNRLSPSPALTVNVYWDLDSKNAFLPDMVTRSTLMYANWTQPDRVPAEAFIYVNAMYNLAYVIIDAVNLDLGNNYIPNMFKNATRLPEVIWANRRPSQFNGTWAEGIPSIYYGSIPSGYETWAQALRDGRPVLLGNPTGLPLESVMVTNYLCPIYRIKPTSSLLSSVFVGAATMTLSVWGAWMLFTASIAKRIDQPQLKCDCSSCERRRNKTENASRERKANVVKTGMLAGFMGIFKGADSTCRPSDPEQADTNTQEKQHDQAISPTLDTNRLSYLGNSATEER